MANSTALLAVQGKMFTVMQAAAPLIALTKVFDDVPEGTALPYVELGEFEETPNNIFGKNGRSVIATLHVYSEAAGYKEVEAILEQLNILFDDTLLPNPTGWRTNLNELVIATLAKEENVVEVRHLIVRYHFDLTQV